MNIMYNKFTLCGLHYGETCVNPLPQLSALTLNIGIGGLLQGVESSSTDVIPKLLDWLDYFCQISLGYSQVLREKGNFILCSEKKCEIC